MKIRRICHIQILLLLIKTTILVALLLFLVLTWNSTPDVNQINSLEIIQWPGIPDYIPNIPQHIIQTSKYSSDIDITNNSFIRLNPTYTYIHYNHSAAEDFIAETMPNYIYQTYISLPEPQMKADYFRYIVLLVNGGIYTDIDTTCLRPIDAWIKRIPTNRTGLIIGIESNASLWDIWLGNFGRQIQFVQWTIAAAPGHPILHQIVKRIADIHSNMERKTESEKQSLEWNGPALWTTIISNYFFDKYGFSSRNLRNLKRPTLVGEDTYVLPVTAFPLGLKRMDSKPTMDTKARVQHLLPRISKDSNGKRSVQ